MDKEILRRIENIKNDQLHGSGWLAAYAVNTLTLCIAESPRKDIKSILKETEILANNIAAARKNMVYISNALYLFQAEVARLSKDRHEVPSFKKAVLVKGNRFLHTMEINSARAALKAARIICNGDTVMTCSYSSLMIGAFLTAKNNNIDFKVIACESMVQDISYGDSPEREPRPVPY